MMRQDLKDMNLQNCRSLLLWSLPELELLPGPWTNSAKDTDRENYYVNFISKRVELSSTHSFFHVGSDRKKGV